MTNFKNSFQHSLARLTVPSQNFVTLVADLFILFIPLRIYELIAVTINHSLEPHWFIFFLLGIVYDLLFVLNIGALIAIPFLLISLWRLQAARIFFTIVGCILLIIHLALISYFISTNVPLGADFYGYSWKEISLTVSSSTGINFWTFVPFVILLGLVVTVNIYSKRIQISQKVTGLSFGLIFFSILISSALGPMPDQFEREANFNLVINKSDFFYEKSWIHFTASEISNLPSFRPYPMYRTFRYNDVLGRFFNRSTENPNLVFIIVEGLGRDFVGKGAKYGGFTPFIDSLTLRSLYWENFLSTSGRTFNVLPSEFGSLPYGANGFMEMGGQMPAHQTMIKLLKQQGYLTSFYYGGNANFDLQDVFLEQQGIDFILDQFQFSPSFPRSAANDKGYSWGYDDGDVFKRSLEIVNAQNKSPRLDIYLTLSTHEPFIPPNEQFYLKLFDERLALLSIPENTKNTYRDYKQIFCTLLYFDDALREFISEYQKRRDFERTIFFITGDHRLIPIPLDEQIDRFHVPFIIYSRMIKEPRKFSSVSTHSDVTPTVLSFLHTNYGIDIADKASWISSGIDTAQGFRNIHFMPLMRNKNELIDYIDGLYYLAGDQIYKLKPDLKIEQIENDSIRTTLKRKLERFKQINRYVCEYNNLYPDTLPKAQNHISNSKDDSIFASLKIDNLDSDQLYEHARKAALNSRFEESRVICRKLLRKNPRNVDVHMLLGRTYAWDKNYETARSIYFDVLHSMPNNTDALSALVDLELWSGNNERALFLSDSSLAYYQDSEALLIRKALALKNLGHTSEAIDFLHKALKLNPNNEEALALKKQLGE